MQIHMGAKFARKLFGRKLFHKIWGQCYDFNIVSLKFFLIKMELLMYVDNTTKILVFNKISKNFTGNRSKLMKIVIWLLLEVDHCFSGF
jgi:hypothetical protein